MFTYCRIDQNILCAWILRCYNFDYANLGFNGLMILYHQSNNPIACTFVHILLNEKQEKKQQTDIRVQAISEKMKDKIKVLSNKFKKTKKLENIPKYESCDLPKELRTRKRIVRNKFYLLIFLDQNPSLIKYRKANSGYLKRFVGTT